MSIKEQQFIKAGNTEGQFVKLRKYYRCNVVLAKRGLFINYAEIARMLKKNKQWAYYWYRFLFN